MYKDASKKLFLNKRGDKDESDDGQSNERRTYFNGFK